MKIAETSRLLIRHFNSSDLASLCELFGDSEVMRYSLGAKSKRETETWLNENIENYRRIGFGLWAVVKKEDDEAIGYCGLNLFPDICGRREIEIGYRLIRRFWNNGFATEAAVAVRDYAFNTLGIGRLIALVDPSNRASINVARKIGMRFEKEVMLAGYEYPDHMYSINNSNGNDNQASEAKARRR